MISLMRKNFHMVYVFHFHLGPRFSPVLDLLNSRIGVWPVPNLEPTRAIRRLNFLKRHGSLLGVLSTDFEPAHFRPRALVPLFNRAKRRRDENKPEFRILENFARNFNEARPLHLSSIFHISTSLFFICIPQEPL